MNRNQLQEKLLPKGHHKETKYLKWYLDIIENANSEDRKKLNKLNEDYIYYENHHILPKTKGLFAEFKNLKEFPWNGVLLTAREHFIVHLCIWKHYKKLKYTYGEIKMSYAIRALSNLGKYNSKHYEHFKLNLEGDTPWNKGKPWSKEMKERFSKTRNRKLKSGEIIPTKHKDNKETLRLIGEASRNRIVTKEALKNQSLGHGGVEGVIKDLLGTVIAQGMLMPTLALLGMSGKNKKYLDNGRVYADTTHKGACTRITSTGKAKFIGWTITSI